MASWSLEYTIDVDEGDAVIRVKVHGRWQAETAKRYHTDFVEDMAPLLGKPWAKIADLTSWKTSRDEVTDVIGRHMAWSRENGVALSLFVIDNVSTFRQLNEMFDKGGTKKISKTFRTLEEAEAYLKKHWLDKRKQ
ncbi:MAG: hypothetical protein J7J98_02725 [candidate division Zixibacteria bacterium]|nr:hypothetical protein [candidate division Zixibacteria bacterium]